VKRQRVTITTVADLAQLSDGDLLGCLTALRQDLTERRWLHEAALASGEEEAGTPFVYREFKWSPPLRNAKRTLSAFVPDTPVQDLPLQRRARESLESHGVRVLKDLASLSERDLLAFQDMGPTTVERLKSWLETAGIRLQTPAALVLAEQRRNLVLQRLEPSELKSARAGLPDEAPVSRLGLPPRTLETGLRAGWLTVGALRGASLEALIECFGRAELRDVLTALNDTGEGLRQVPPQLALWKAGVLPAREMRRPDEDSTPVGELEPWLGGVVQRLDGAGIKTLGALRSACASERVDEVHRIGPQAMRAIRAYCEAAEPRNPANSA